MTTNGPTIVHEDRAKVADEINNEEYGTFSRLHSQVATTSIA